MAKSKKAKAGEEFVFCNGARAAGITDFRKELKKLTEGEFAYHVNEYRNDFYNWLHDCINPDLASKIEGVKSKEEMVKLLS